jgi:lipoprotein-anchoring transpeptidase ErfK/SrfK
VKRGRGQFVLAALATLVGPTALAASDAPPWRDEGDLPLPDAPSVVVLRGEQAVLDTPSAAATRRGTAKMGAHLPWFGAKRGSGCAARWINVGPLAWICQDALAFDTAPPLVPGLSPEIAATGGLPFRYYFVGREGATGYVRLEDAEDVAPSREFEPGFAVAVVDEGAKGNERYARTHHGHWIPMRELVAVTPFEFKGEEIRGGKLDFAWVVEDRAVVYVAPGGAASKADPGRRRFDKVEVLEEKVMKAGTYVRIADRAWLRARDVRRPNAVPAPSSLRAGERWIDVDLATQTLIAFEGEAPVFATLVSTGKGKEGTESATPRGEFRIWVKLASSNMDNLEDEEAARYYAIEDVPFVQFFAKGVGLHGAFWHRGFGHERSHGCVNLAPVDAQRLFAFTSPHLPAGWTAVLPSVTETGTLVRVR